MWWLRLAKELGMRGAGSGRRNRTLVPHTRPRGEKRKIEQFSGRISLKHGSFHKIGVIVYGSHSPRSPQAQARAQGSKVSSNFMHHHRQSIRRWSEFRKTYLLWAQGLGVRSVEALVRTGIGFAKTGEANCEVMAGLRKLRGQLPRAVRGCPLLLGPSRKAFIGRITGKEAKSEGCASAVAATVVFVGRCQHRTECIMLQSGGTLPRMVDCQSRQLRCACHSP
eukprot:jgi/Botrbrau1/5008/Bobra.0396s0029.1